MYRISMATLFSLLLFAESVDAQVVISPHVYGWVSHTSSAAGGKDLSDAEANGELLVGTVTYLKGTTIIETVCGGVSCWGESVWATVYFYQHHKGVLEFDLAGAAFPGSMTPSNFRARLRGLIALSTTAVHNIELFDLADSAEDGDIDTNDWLVSESISPVSLNSVVSDGNLVFDDVDVTEQIRWDLFGDADDNLLSGFVLRRVGRSYGSTEPIAFDPSRPSLLIEMISVKWYVVCK